MLNKLICHIQAELEDIDFVETIGGLVKDIKVKVAGNEKHIPVSFEINKDECRYDNYRDLTPDSTKKSILFFDVLSEPTITEEHRHYFVFEAKIRICVWINYKAVNIGLWNNSILAANILKYVANKYDNLDYMSAIRLFFAGQVNEDIYDKFNFDEAEKQYLTYPYSTFGMDYDVTWRVATSCVPDVALNVNECPDPLYQVWIDTECVQCWQKPVSDYFDIYLDADYNVVYNASNVVSVWKDVRCEKTGLPYGLTDTPEIDGDYVSFVYPFEYLFIGERNNAGGVDGTWNLKSVIQTGAFTFMYQGQAPTDANPFTKYLAGLSNNNCPGTLNELVVQRLNTGALVAYAKVGGNTVTAQTDNLVMPLDTDITLFVCFDQTNGLHIYVGSQIQDCNGGNQYIPFGAVDLSLWAIDGYPAVHELNDICGSPAGNPGGFKTKKWGWLTKVVTQAEVNNFIANGNI